MMGISRRFKSSSKVCPKCRHPLDAMTQCGYCGIKLALKPDFLSTLSSKVLFVSGAFLLGSFLSDTLTAIGLGDFGMGRLLAECMIGAGYYHCFRFVFAYFQQPMIVVSTDHQKDHNHP